MTAAQPLLGVMGTVACLTVAWDIYNASNSSNWFKRTNAEYPGKLSRIGLKVSEVFSHKASGRIHMKRYPCAPHIRQWS
jgi:hypothetical protein